MVVTGDNEGGEGTRRRVEGRLLSFVPGVRAALVGGLSCFPVVRHGRFTIAVEWRVVLANGSG